MKEIYVVSGINSLQHIAVRGAALRGAEAPGRSGLLGSSRSQGTVCGFVALRPRLPGMVGRPAVGRIGEEVEGVMTFARGG